MAGGLVNGMGKNYGYEKYTIMDFPSYESLEAFVETYNNLYMTPTLTRANEKNLESLATDLSTQSKSDYYGLFGKNPTSIEEAMKRDKFVYFDEYKKIKEEVMNVVQKELFKATEVEIMQPQFVFNDRQLGEFIYDRAAMSLQPQIFYYSFVHNREVLPSEEKVYLDKTKGLDVWRLESDNSVIVLCLKVTKDDGLIEFIEAKGDESLREATRKGKVSVTSSNKKVYLYKEKKPKHMNAVKLFVGLTRGGYTSWDNDFYTGVATGIALEILESLGYSVEIIVATGGGRCSGCPIKLNFGGILMRGRRFFTFVLKKFDDLTDLDRILYTIADPSWHNVKFSTNMNSLLSFYGDPLNTEFPQSFVWHGIESKTDISVPFSDMENPIGSYHKYLDRLNGIGNVLYYYFHKIDKDSIVQSIMNMVRTVENINFQILEKSKKYG